MHHQQKGSLTYDSNNSYHVFFKNKNSVYRKIDWREQICNSLHCKEMHFYYNNYWFLFILVGTHWEIGKRSGLYLPYLYPLTYILNTGIMAASIRSSLSNEPAAGVICFDLFWGGGGGGKLQMGCSIFLFYKTTLCRVYSKDTTKLTKNTGT